MRVILESADSAGLRELVSAMVKCGLGIVIMDESMEVVCRQESRESCLDDIGGRMSHALKMLEQDGTIRHKYDYTWIMVAIGDGAVKGMSAFRSPQSFMDYLQSLGVESVPSRTTISTWYNRVVGRFPDWKFTDTKDPREIIRRKNVVKRLICALEGAGT